MRVSKQLVGRFVEVTWRDPAETGRVKRSEVLQGRAALATWEECGVIEDVSEGVVFIRHSRSREFHAKEEELVGTYVPEDLIEKVVTYSPDSGGTP